MNLLSLPYSCRRHIIPSSLQSIYLESHPPSPSTSHTLAILDCTMRVAHYLLYLSAAGSLQRAASIDVPANFANSPRLLEKARGKAGKTKTSKTKVGKGKRRWKSQKFPPDEPGMVRDIILNLIVPIPPYPNPNPNNVNVLANSSESNFSRPYIWTKICTGRMFVNYGISRKYGRSK